MTLLCKTGMKNISPPSGHLRSTIIVAFLFYVETTDLGDLAQNTTMLVYEPVLIAPVLQLGFAVLD